MHGDSNFSVTLFMTSLPLSAIKCTCRQKRVPKETKVASPPRNACHTAVHARVPVQCRSLVKTISHLWSPADQGGNFSCTVSHTLMLIESSRPSPRYYWAAVLPKIPQPPRRVALWASHTIIKHRIPFVWQQFDTHLQDTAVRTPCVSDT